MRLPFTGTYRTTQGFGENPAVYARFGISGHNGIDYGLPTGTSVVAMEAGIAYVMEDPGGYGHFVRVVGKYQIDYAHLQKATVAHGSRVTEGQQIALSNNSGNSTGPHLHITVKPMPADKNNGYLGAIDPLQVLNNQGGEEVIRDTDNEFNRANDTFIRIRGRAMSREEFRKNIVGLTWLRFIEVLVDGSSEAAAAQHAQEVGTVAVRDNWHGQITGLLTKVSDLTEQGHAQQKTITQLNEQIKTLQTAQQAPQSAPVVQPPTSTTPVVPTSPAAPGAVKTAIEHFLAGENGKIALQVGGAVLFYVLDNAANFGIPSGLAAAIGLALGHTVANRTANKVNK